MRLTSWCWRPVGRLRSTAWPTLDRLEIGSVGVAGWSAGGRVALALAARRPDLVDRVVVLATPAPEEEVAWMPGDYKDMMADLSGQSPAVVHARLADRLACLLPV